MRLTVAVITVLAAAALLSVSAVGAAPSQGAGASGVKFLTGPTSGKPLEIALGYVRANAQKLGLTSADVGDMAVTDVYTDAHNGVTHVYLRQRHGGIEVDGGNINVNVTRDGSIINLGNRFVSGLAGAINRTSPARTAREGVQDAAKGLGLDLRQALRVEKVKGGPAQEVVFDRAGISLEPIPARLVYAPTANGAARLAWNVGIYETDAQHYWSANVDAATGDLLSKADYVDEDADQYRVFAIPKESPSDGPRTLETDPANATASPFAWHDTDGAPGAEFTVTRGNNAHAYTDVDANGVPDPGSDPDGGLGLVFDFPLDLTQNPDTYRPAAVTNLFYWNNLMHDVTYAYGFTEAAGNFQVNNYGNGGLGGDDVRAEAQDGSGTNNANFLTPADGSRPRMQMFVWTNPFPYLVTVNAPSPIAGDYTATRATFGPQLTLAGVTGDVTLVDDATGLSPTDGCEALVGFPAGNLALVDRGNCTFVQKVVNAQAAGASAVIVANNAPGPPILMGFTPPIPPITIPAAMVSQDDGNLFKANLPFDATARANPVTSINRDSDLDAGVIAHEYGHGISNRLTGGPSTVGCLSNAEQMGEGWSDWFALVMTAKGTAAADRNRGIATYLVYEPASGVGIRPTQYSPDMTIDPATYDTIKTAAIPHGVGYVWNTMLWEVYWNLVGVYGFNPNIYGAWSTGGNNLANQLVMDGMKLQPCSPGFVNGRDAILLADQALTGGANQCAIWRGFAKRGLGLSAIQGSSGSVLDGTQAFDMPAGVCFAFSGFFGPASKSPPDLNTANAGATVPVVFSLGGNQGLDIFAKDYPKSQQIDCTTKAPIGPEQSTATAGGSGLTYNAATDRYTYPWKTEAGWKNTCRQLVVRLKDSTDHIAYFQFK